MTDDGNLLAPGLVISGYTAGTKRAPKTQMLFAECEGATKSPGSHLEICYSYTTGDFNYYKPETPVPGTLTVDLDALAQPTYPGTPATGLAVAKVGEPIDAINQNTLTLVSAERTADGMELSWHTENPTKYPVYVHIGIPPVVGSDVGGVKFLTKRDDVGKIAEMMLKFPLVTKQTSSEGQPVSKVLVQEAADGYTGHRSPRQIV